MDVKRTEFMSILFKFIFEMKPNHSLSITELFHCLSFGYARNYLLKKVSIFSFWLREWKSSTKADCKRNSILLYFISINTFPLSQQILHSFQFPLMIWSMNSRIDSDCITQWLSSSEIHLIVSRSNMKWHDQRNKRHFS